MPENSVKTAIIQALVTDGVKFVIAIKKSKKIIQTIFSFFFPIIEFCNTYVSPRIMYDT